MIELLVVLAILGILASLLLPALARGKAKAQSTVCSGSLKQLGAAFMMYVSDHDDAFPAGSPVSSMGTQPEDWIWWQVQAGTGKAPVMRDGHGSVIAPYLGGYHTRYFRCPADRDALAREVEWRNNLKNELYIYSYSLNGHTEKGMATYISQDRSVIFRNKLGAVVNPSIKIMLAEEKGSPEDGTGSAVINDGRWQPLGYPLTMRHSGKANVTFADAHVEKVSRAFADVDHPEHYDPSHH